MMSHEEKFWIATWSIIGVTMITVVLLTTNYYYKIESKMATMGYEQTTTIGTNRLVWQKKDNECHQ